MHGDVGAVEKRRLMAQIVKRHFVRVQMTLIVLASLGSSLMVSKMLHLAGVGSMAVRYPVAILSAYLVFLLGVRLWLRYAGFDRVGRTGGDAIDMSGVADVDVGSFDLPAGKGGSAVLTGRGGGFGGGGASESFSEGPVRGGWFSGTKGSSSGSVGLDLDGDGFVAILLIGLLVFVVVGAGGYLIYQAPSILADAAFQMVLAGGMVRRAKRMEQQDWTGSVVRATWLSFAGVLAVAMAFALYAGSVYPDARTMAEVVATALQGGGQ